MEDSTPSLSWGHINLNVRNLERSIAFYEKLGFQIFIPSIPYLGLTLEGEASVMPPDCAEALGIDASTRGRACIMGLKGAFPMIDLTEFEGGEPAQPPSTRDLGAVRICLSSQELASDYAHLVGAGVPFQAPPCLAKEGMATIAICSDPDGTLIELIQLHMENWSSS